MIPPLLSFSPPPCVLSHLLIQSSLMLTRRSLSNVFGGGQVLLSFLKIEVLCLLAAGRKASLPGGYSWSSLASHPILILKCLSHARTVEKIPRLKWDAVLQHSFFSLLEKDYMRKSSFYLKRCRTGRNLAYFLHNQIFTWGIFKMNNLESNIFNNMLSLNDLQKVP